MRGILAFVPVVALVFAVAAAIARPDAAHTTPLGSPVVLEGTVAMSVEDDFQSGRATRHDTTSLTSRVPVPGTTSG